jgi:hypothetical protein
MLLLVFAKRFASDLTKRPVLASARVELLALDDKRGCHGWSSSSTIQGARLHSCYQ